MPHVARFVAPPGNASAYAVVDPSIKGLVKAYIAAPAGQSTNIVFNVGTAALAQDEQTASRYYQIQAGQGQHVLEFDPSTTWVRSSTATGGYTLTFQFVW